MRKILMFVVLISLLSSCSIFKRSRKVGCPTSGAAIGAERLLDDPKLLKKSMKSKFKGD